MKIFLLSIALAVSALPVSAQDTYVPDDGIVYETLPYDGEVGDGGEITYDVLPYDDAGDAYGIPLAPGEEIMEIYAAPSIVRMPMAPEILYETDPYDPPEDIDRVTGLPRNTAGWTGTYEAPLGIGCFPQGVCAGLNE